tara:strand:+ start:92 stop:460 length:369 start_codon:yes stop_codon:yes gene_type:complete
MGFACGAINDGMGMGQDTSGIRSLLRPLEQRLRSNNQEEVNAFLDEIDKMANDRFGDAIKKNTEIYNTQRDEFFKGLQDRIRPFMGTPNESNTGGIQFADMEETLGPSSLYGNYHASKTTLE